MSHFFQDVYEVVKLIPEGRVTSYGAIAHYLGSKLSARMVGWAMNAAHADPEIPAQQVRALTHSDELRGNDQWDTRCVSA